MKLSFTVDRAAGEIIALPLGDTDLRMSWCPPGRFLMGSEDGSHADARLHEVTLSAGFWISTTTVTQRQWRTVTGVMYRAKNDVLREFPVETVTWDRAIEFCWALTERLRRDQTIDETAFCCLPTEAQWEFACRANTTTPWYFGSTKAALTQSAWFDENSGGKLHEVAWKPPNPWGLHDAYGNVSEWCLDDYAQYEDCVDPIGELDGALKVTRGGCYADRWIHCQSAARAPLLRSNPFLLETGLRVVINHIQAWRHRSTPLTGLLRR